MARAARPWLRFGALAALLSCLWAPQGATAAEHSCDSSSPQRRVLRFVGDIDPDEARRFNSSFDSCFPPSYRGQVVLDLFSGGGLVNEALAIANRLVTSGQETRPVLTRISRGSYCVSACTYLYVAGRFREAEVGGSFEPHGFSKYRSLRVDIVMRLAKRDREGMRIATENFGPIRLSLLALTLHQLIDTDERLAWLGPLLADYARRDRLLRRDALDRLVTAWDELTPAQRELVATLDSIVIVVMTELERESALQAFGPLLQRGPAAERLNALPANDAQRFADWMSAEFRGTLNTYLAATKSGRPLADLRSASAAIQDYLGGEASSTMKTVNERLWPYLSRRDDVLDVAGFVKLMFSTSIIYTRPLTHEEMCDLNIVNRGCD